MELSCESLGDGLLATIFQLAYPGDGFGRLCPLDVNLSVLLPRAHVWVHLYLDRFLEEFIHLEFNRVLVSISDQPTNKVHARHLIIVTMFTSEAPHHLELSIKQVVSVSSVSNTIVNDQLL